MTLFKTKIRMPKTSCILVFFSSSFSNTTFWVNPLISGYSSVIVNLVNNWLDNNDDRRWSKAMTNVRWSRVIGCCGSNFCLEANKAKLHHSIIGRKLFCFFYPIRVYLTPQPGFRIRHFIHVYPGLSGPENLNKIIVILSKLKSELSNVAHELELVICKNKLSNFGVHPDLYYFIHFIQ